MSEQPESPEQSQPVPPPLQFIPPTLPPPPPRRPPSYWLRRFLACNPFYLVSAMLLLFGVYQISEDSRFLPSEALQLAFNFTSLNLYEVLVVATAVFLARRKIWYDARLLTGLESLLIFLPFILVSQAALIDTRSVWVMCLAGGALALIRFALLNRYLLSVASPMGGIYSALLVVNVALPMIYRSLGETKLGIKPALGPAYNVNELAWLILLPAAFALANLLPYARERERSSAQCRWLPAGLFTLWAIATGIHLYSLGYVYDFDLRPELLAPALCVLAWTAFHRLPDLFGLPAHLTRSILSPIPLLTALLAFSREGSFVFLTLAVANAALYGILWVGQRDRFAKQLLYASVVMLVAGLPLDVITMLLPGLGRDALVLLSAAVYLMLQIGFSRDPRLGMLGAGILAAGITAIFKTEPDAVHGGLQCGFVFLLLHSLRWEDARHPGATAVRYLASGCWLTHAFLFVHSGGTIWMTLVPGLVVLGVYLVVTFLRGRWYQSVLPLSAGLAALTGPGDMLLRVVTTLPGGVLAMLASLGLFAMGTLTALTRHRWHHR